MYAGRPLVPLAFREPTEGCHDGDDDPNDCAPEQGDENAGDDEDAAKADASGAAGARSGDQAAPEPIKCTLVS